MASLESFLGPIDPRWVVAGAVLLGVLVLGVVGVWVRRRQAAARRQVEADWSQLREQLLPLATETNFSGEARGYAILRAKAARSQPERLLADADLLAAVIHVALLNGEAAEGERLLDAATTRYPGDPRWSDLGIELLVAKRAADPRSIDRLGEAFRRCPERADWGRRYLALVIAGGPPTAAALHLVAQFQQRHHDLRALQFLADHYEKKKVFNEKSRPFFEAIVEHEKDKVRWHYALARSRHQMGDLAGARQALEQVLRLDPRHQPALEFRRLLQGPPRATAPAAGAGSSIVETPSASPAMHSPAGGGAAPGSPVASPVPVAVHARPEVTVAATTSPGFSGAGARGAPGGSASPMTLASPAGGVTSAVTMAGATSAGAGEAPLAAPGADPSGPAVGLPPRYVRVVELGRGGMGVVYQAFDDILRRPVAIKVLNEALAVSQPGLRDRFLAESRTLAVLDHPSIPKVFDVSVQAPSYIAFEFIAGETLRALINAGELPLSRVVGLGIELAEGFHHATSKGVLHRDIKPDNVLVEPGGRARIVDFGLAQGEGQGHLTQTGVVLGTPWYLAPERLRGEPASVASEIFAYGVTLYETLCRQRPFTGDDVNVVFAQDPRPPREVREECTARLEILILDCINKNPRNRPASFAEVAAELRSIVGGADG